MTSFPVSESPHIRKEESGKSIAVKTLFALLIPILARLCLEPLSSLVLVLGILAGASAAFLIKERLFCFQNSGGYWNAGVFSAVLIFLMPFNITLGASFLAGFFLVFFGTWFFGQYASLIFHPGVLACLLIANIYPDNFASGAVGLRGMILLAASLTGGVILCLMRVIPWKIPTVYLISVSMGIFIGIKPQDLFSTWSLGVIAFFVLTDSATSPLKRSAQVLSAFLTAAITVALSPVLSLGNSALLSAVIINALSPWLDEGK